MTLPNATLFPQAMLPLYIFEPRYRKMLEDALATHRMFSVAMQKPGRVRETPSNIAGLGLIRASVANPDGTSNLILQGIARVELTETVQSKPYRVHRIQPIRANEPDSVALDAMVSRLLELANERLEQGIQLPVHIVGPEKKTKKPSHEPPVLQSLRQSIQYLTKIKDHEPLADLIACTLVRSPLERQIILETMDLELRYRHLIHFLMAEILRHRKDNPA